MTAHVSVPRDGRLTFDCHGVIVVVEPADVGVIDVVRSLLPPAPPARAGAAADATYAWTHAGNGNGSPLHVVTMCSGRDRPQEEIARIADAHAAADLLARDIEYRVALHARRRLFVHAAAVAWEGRAVLVPGRSFSGKSTLAAALLRRGATYLSDEYAVLDENGLVHPFPRPLRLRDANGTHAWRTSAEELGSSVAPGPLPVGLVVWTSYRADATWRPQPMTAGQTALALLDNGVVSRLRPAYALRVIARAVAGAEGLQGPRGSADDAARDILDCAAAIGAARS